MKIITLMENTACADSYCHAHGLSLFLRTPRHRVLFDMGPDNGFAENAEKLGVDLGRIDLAILSHGHFDHGGGLRMFLAENTRGTVCVHEGAFGAYYAQEADGTTRYIGLDQGLKDFQDRFAITRGVVRIDDELTLFDGVEDTFGSMTASAKLKEQTTTGLTPDLFDHEQNLLITAEGKAVLVAGCAHRGIVNIKAKAEALLGRELDAVVSGFHLFQLSAGDTAGDALIDRTGQALLPGNTVYYTGHCTGDYAFERLHGILGNRLRRISGGETVEL